MSFTDSACGAGRINYRRHWLEQYYREPHIEATRLRVEPCSGLARHTKAFTTVLSMDFEEFSVGCVLLRTPASRGLLEA